MIKKKNDRFFSPLICLFLQKDRDRPEQVQPIASSTLIHSDLTSVYGTMVMNRTVLFLGTGDGQLLKVGFSVVLRMSPFKKVHLLPVCF